MEIKIMAKTRIYRVIETESDAADRLVDAGSQSQAIRHVVGSRFEATIASPHEVANLVSKGVMVETAGSENAAE
jgi:hypothetical protein